MRLADRLLLQQKSGKQAEEIPASMIRGSGTARRGDDLGEASRKLKSRIHNRLLETLDVSKLDALEPAMISSKVTAAINDTLDSEGRLLTELDRARLVSEIKNELLGVGPLEP